MNPDPIQQQNACQCFHDLPQKGFFGKPTKLRNLEPSMFQLLTWKSQQAEQTNSKVNYRQPPNPNYKACCGCKNSQTKHSNQHEDQEHTSLKKNPQNRTDAHQNKSKKRETLQVNDHYQAKTKGKNSKVYEKDVQLYENERTLDKRKKSNENLRPKSAIHNQSKKQNSIIPKSPNFKQQQKNHLKTDEDSYLEDQEQNQAELIKKFKQTTRWIPNSAFTTYFGKPAFENYGRGNTKPSSGGLMYGNYLKSHNVQPHRGMNSPKNKQSYAVALMKAKKIGTIEPYPPKVSQKQNVHENESKKKSKCEDNSIYPDKNNSKNLPIKNPNLYDLQKFGGKGIKKIPKSSYERLYSETVYKNEQTQKEDKNYFETYKIQPEYEIRKKPFPEGRKVK